MKTTIYILSATLFFLALSFTSCKSSRKITKAIERKDSTVKVTTPSSNSYNDSITTINNTWQKVLANNISYNTFSAKVKVDYEDGESKLPDFNAFVRIQKDSIIWVNVEAFGLINVARILIRKDSFFIINYNDKNYRNGSIATLQQTTGIPFDFSTIEAVLVGNPIFTNNQIASYKKQELTTSIGFLGEIFKSLITIENATHLISNVKIDDVDVTRSRTCNVSYANYELENNFQFSKERTIVITEKSKIQIDLKYKQVKFGEALTFPFKVPKSYKKI